MHAVGQRLRDARVAAIYLMHGTFVGFDAIGVIAHLESVVPRIGEAVRNFAKRTVDSLAGDRGNYTAEYAATLERAINERQANAIPVRRLNWSSENHHVGRADGAMRLIDELASRGFNDNDRVLCWGHSHAGNVFALATNLLGGDRESVEDFFARARWQYRWPLVGRIDLPLWSRVERRLLDDRASLPRPELLDFVTFGAPIRYGWESAGFGKLLHFVHHRPQPNTPEFLAPFPFSAEQIASAAAGDYVHQLGIAGTNVWPGLFAWRTSSADRKLDALLERDLTPAKLVDRWRVGQRVADGGTTLLVDYPIEGESLAQHMAGHAVYTQGKWMSLHAEQIAAELYSESQP